MSVTYGDVRVGALLVTCPSLEMTRIGGYVYPHVLSIFFLKTTSIMNIVDFQASVYLVVSTHSQIVGQRLIPGSVNTHLPMLGARPPKSHSIWFMKWSPIFRCYPLPLPPLPAGCRVLSMRTIVSSNIFQQDIIFKQNGPKKNRIHTLWHSNMASWEITYKWRF